MGVLKSGATDLVNLLGFLTTFHHTGGVIDFGKVFFVCKIELSIHVVMQSDCFFGG